MYSYIGWKEVPTIGFAIAALLTALGIPIPYLQSLADAQKRAAAVRVPRSNNRVRSWGCAPSQQLPLSFGTSGFFFYVYLWNNEIINSSLEETMERLAERMSFPAIFALIMLMLWSGPIRAFNEFQFFVLVFILLFGFTAVQVQTRRDRKDAIAKVAIAHFLKNNKTN
jgi:hypothetical protein